MFVHKVAVPFAAGALLATAFLDLIPEALADHQHERTLLIILVGFLFFFVLEQSLGWFHHHHEESETDTHTDKNVWLIVIGDTDFITSLMDWRLVQRFWSVPQRE